MASFSGSRYNNGRKKVKQKTTRNKKRMQGAERAERRRKGNLLPSRQWCLSGTWDALLCWHSNSTYLAEVTSRVDLLRRRIKNQ